MKDMVEIARPIDRALPQRDIGWRIIQARGGGQIFFFQRQAIEERFEGRPRLPARLNAVDVPRR